MPKKFCKGFPPTLEIDTLFHSNGKVFMEERGWRVVGWMNCSSSQQATAMGRGRRHNFFGAVEDPTFNFFDEWEAFIDGGKHAIKWGSSQTYIVLLHYPTGNAESACLMCSGSLFVGQTPDYSACCVTCHRRWRPSPFPSNLANLPHHTLSQEGRNIR